MQDSMVLCLGDSAWGGGNIGIYRSIDHGLTWSMVHPVPLSGFAAPVLHSLLISGNRAFAGIGNYVLSSTNDGLTWGDSVHLNCSLIYSIAISPSQSGNAYLFAGTDSGVFRSSDNGAHWTAANYRLDFCCGKFICVQSARHRRGHYAFRRNGRWTILLYRFGGFLEDYGKSISMDRYV